MRWPCLLLAALGLAGCGGGEPPRAVDHIGYEVRLSPLDDAVGAALRREEDAAERLRAVARGLERVVPPPNAAWANGELALVLQHLAEDVEAGDMLAFAEDWESLQDLLYALMHVGYQPLDGPDDE